MPILRRECIHAATAWRRRWWQAAAVCGATLLMLVVLFFSGERDGHGPRKTCRIDSTNASLITLHTGKPASLSGRAPGVRERLLCAPDAEQNRMANVGVATGEEGNKRVLQEDLDESEWLFVDLNLRQCPCGDSRPLDALVSECRAKLGRRRKEVATSREGSNGGSDSAALLPDRKTRVERLARMAQRAPPLRKLGAKNDANTKYQKRTSKGACENRGMWAGPVNTECVLRIAGGPSFGNYQSGQMVLDWGTGCGAQATFLTAMFDVDVLGLDVAPSVQLAQKHGLGAFVRTDGTDMSWIPDASFDHFYSFATVYYVPVEIMVAFCVEVERILRPGGTALFGWLDGHYSHGYSYVGSKEVREFARKGHVTIQKGLFEQCASITGANVTIVPDKVAWGDERADHISMDNSYSVFMTKTLQPIALVEQM